jgi:hypothetical protein
MNLKTAWQRLLTVLLCTGVIALVLAVMALSFYLDRVRFVL